MTPTNQLTASALAAHFGKCPLDSLVTASRTYPLTAQADFQRVFDCLLDDRNGDKLLGVHQQWSHETATFAHLIVTGEHPVLIGPLCYEEMDIGESYPGRFLVQGLWLGKREGLQFAVLIARMREYGQRAGVRIELAVPPGEPGLRLSREMIDEFDRRVKEGTTYRGKILSLEPEGQMGQCNIRVHRLAKVERQDVILPPKTLELLERNVGGFVKQRERLAALGMSVKKGVLFYGPPGTGKTHTIHFLAGQLTGHTTLLMTASQVAYLSQYMQIARLLQPSIVVIEDVDLIARARQQMRGACEESLLNELLNEMDGMRRDAAILFILTTNNPTQIEVAIASRPGRVDQSIEFPLPDEDGRAKLVRLYAHKLVLDEPLVNLLVSRTRNCSAAFIKELMRRCAQFFLADQSARILSQDHIESAVEEMLITGGSLNLKLLGVTQ